MPIWISIISGLTMLGILSFVLAKEQKTNPWIIIVEHLIIALAVIFVTHYVGDFISFAFS